MTPEQKEQAREKRYRQKYGIGIEDYNRLLEAQDGCCAVCGRPATDFTVSLNIDHQHFKVSVYRYNPTFEALPLPDVKWIAHAETIDPYTYWGGKTKQEAIDSCKTNTMKKSIRGLLCPGRYSGCNRLMGRIDNLPWLRKVIAYLENPPAKKVLISNPEV